MPINYGLVDPTEGMNRGLGTLAQALQYRQQMERQAAQDAMTAKSHGLQNTLSQMGIDKITAEQGALMSATGQPDLKSALGAQLKAKTEGEAQKLQAEKLARYSAVLEHLSKAPFDDATKAQYLKAAIGKDPDFADFVKTMSIQSQPKASDYSVEKIYGPGGATKAVPVSKTGGYTPESGWSLAPPLKPDTISPAAEAQQVRIAKAKSQAEGGSSLPAMLPGGPVGARDDRALSGATSGEQAIVKQLVEYKMPLPSGFALKSPYWQNIMQRAALYDPSFDASQYNVRLKLRNDFVSGKSGQNIRSLNTAVGHLGELAKAASNLQNGPLQLWNKISNYGLTQTGDSRVTRFLAAATAVEGELANVFKNTGATDQEIKAWRENLSSSQSPEQLQGNIKEVVGLLGGRLGALQSQYEAGMGKPKDFKMLSDKSRKILAGIGVDVNALDPVSANASGGAGSAGGRGRDVAPAITYLKASTTRQEAISRIRALADKGWTKDELTAIAKDSGWE